MEKILDVEVPGLGTVETEVYYELAYDSSYGADIDGNRGVPMEWIEDFHVVSTKEPIHKDYTDTFEELAYRELERECDYD